MKLKFTRKTWYFFLLVAAAASMLNGFAVLGGMDFSFLEMVAFCITGITVLFLAAEKGAPTKEKRNYFLAGYSYQPLPVLRPYSPLMTLSTTQKLGMSLGSPLSA